MSGPQSNPSEDDCCGCFDDEANKHGECFCLCHTLGHLDRSQQDCRQCGPREIALGQCNCMRKIYAPG